MSFQEHAERRVYIVLLAITIATSLIGAAVRADASREFSDSVQRALPLLFVFAAMYYNERAVFFDVIAKRGMFILLSLVLLTLYFAVVPGLFFTARLGWVGMWVYPMSMLPLIAIAPWGYRQISSFLDHHWLGRSFTAAAAHQFFLDGLTGATTERELAEAAEQRLTSIYRAEAQVVLDNEPVMRDGIDRFDAPITTRGERLGAVHITCPPGGRPLLSEDRTQIVSMANSLGLMLENLRLREKKLIHEGREQDLRLQTSRAELRALRAQINPHFLFNALNSIAALIATDPEQAEATVERLSELFRYTLRNWDGEWVRVQDEMAFVRCYLDIEKTRFQRRLSVSIEQDANAAEALVPALIIETLVENAIKHGIAPMRGTGSVMIHIARQGNDLRIEVRDSGPGFSREPSSVGATGHGLKNVQERLRAHFGDEAQLTISRDESAGMTAVVLRMPLVFVPASAELQNVP